ncbi:MAG: gliding motility-associated C-terminal domain-containing protein, partial [Saprospiraceae bacterium]
VNDPATITATFDQNTPTRFNSCDGETIITAVGATGSVTYSWSGSNSHSGTEARADGLCAGEVVTFVIVDDKGCSAIARDTIAYPEDGCLLGSPVITPGQKDGKNDELFITCAETLNNKVEIFNRWGQLVFSVENYDNNGVVWTGETKSGAALPEGVYFYVMTYTDDQGTDQRIKGYVNLLR